MPRRLTGKEEAELLEAAKRLAAAQAEEERLLADRDRLIADLLEDGVRMVDVADVLGLTRKAVYDARERARGR
ncbi:MAG TPA: hypothetical protein VMD09_12740 [Solirubrobacteraceae bacterium]|nr:hypothetical protein [Solirubrobacteraceae bacterium]